MNEVKIESAAKAAPRPTAKVWGGIVISKIHSRRPRVLRLEPSKPKGSNVGIGK